MISLALDMVQKNINTLSANIPYSLMTCQSCLIPCSSAHRNGSVAGASDEALNLIGNFCGHFVSLYVRQICTGWPYIRETNIDLNYLRFEVPLTYSIEN